MQKLWGVDAVGRKRKREKRLLFRFLFSLEFDQNCPFLFLFLSLSLSFSLFFLFLSSFFFFSCREFCVFSLERERRNSGWGKCGLGSERERNREEWWYGGCVWLGERVKFTLRRAPSRRSISSKSRAGARTGAKSRRELESLCFLSVVSFSNAETAEKNKQKEG